MTTSRTIFARLTVTLIGVLALAGGMRAQHKASDVPVDFGASVSVTGPLGTAATSMKVHIDKYTSEFDRTTIVNALRTNGYQAFLPAFRKLPVVGYIQIKDQKWTLRWAHQTPKNPGQSVIVATDQPMFFLGAGQTNKPRAGYEMGIVQMELDEIGMGTGTMAGAARVKPTADMQGVQIDDFADVPTKLTSISRIFS
jgi:hypothetical protein